MPQRHRPCTLLEFLHDSHNLLCVRGDSNTTKHFLKDSIVAEASVLIICTVCTAQVFQTQVGLIGQSLMCQWLWASIILAIVEADRPLSVMCFNLSFVISANITLYKETILVELNNTRVAKVQGEELILTWHEASTEQITLNTLTMWLCVCV